MQCQGCKLVQPIFGKCVGCGLQMARYSCDTCCYFGHLPNLHCQKCNTCVLNPTGKTHICVAASTLPEICSLCFDPIQDALDMYSLPCKHQLHTHCAYQLFRTDHTLCPLCRQNIRPIVLCMVCLQNIACQRLQVKAFRLKCGHHVHVECARVPVSLGWTCVTCDAQKS